MVFVVEMVFYFSSNVTDPPAIIYMGKDKFENEDLIKYGWDEDIWFHVDKLSSAHVYLRMNPNQTWDALPEELVADLAQLTKANSIEGNKKANVVIIYTPWHNLRKSGDMAVGQVSFHNPKLVRRVHVEKRINEIINRLNKTKTEAYPDLQAERLTRDKKLRALERERLAQEKELENKQKEDWKRQKEASDYSNLFSTTAMQSNKNQDDPEDDFM